MTMNKLISSPKKISEVEYVISKWFKSIIQEKQRDIDWIILMIGGSHSKGVSDLDSDLDVSLICPDDFYSNICEHIASVTNVIVEQSDQFGTRLSLLIDERLFLDMHLTLLCHNNFAENQIDSYL